MSMTPELDYRLNIPVPAGATRVGQWEPDTRGTYVRMFDGTHRAAHGVCIDIIGAQGVDGEVRARWVIFGPLDDRKTARDLTAAQARGLAERLLTGAEPDHLQMAADTGRALIAAADEIQLLDCPLCLGKGVICEADGDVLCPHVDEPRGGGR